jgi:L-ascorbate metabolism protein UlaG (beta-lactamase superfamily)
MERRVPTPALVVALLLAGATSGCMPAFRVHAPLDPVLYPPPPRNAITFWGHATSYIDVDGYGIVTDPVFVGAYTPWNKRLIPAPPPAAYAQARLVLISHAHQDHLSPETLAQFPPGTVVLCPRPAARYLRDLRLDVRAMAAGDAFDFPGGQAIAVVADHPGGRRSLKARPDGRALGYVVRTSLATVYYSGDTKYFPGFQRVGATYHPDIAILNVNRHLHSIDARQAAHDVGARIVIPSHALAYGSPTARRNRRWRAEFVALLGPVARPLAVGESLPLADARR